MKELYWVIDDVLAGRCGPAVSPWDPKRLHDAGIRGIISLDEAGVNPGDLRAVSIAHYPAYLPMTLLLSQPERQQFLAALPPIFEFIDGARRRSSATLVHCHYGLDRTGAVLACYLVSRERLAGEEAVERIRQLRPQALLAPGYAESVLLFAQKQAAAKRTSPPRNKR